MTDSSIEVDADPLFLHKSDFNSDVASALKKRFENDRNILSYIAERPQTDIPPGMPLIGGLTAQRIQRALPGIDVGQLLNKAVEPQLAIDRQTQTGPLTGICMR